MLVNLNNLDSAAPHHLRAGNSSSANQDEHGGHHIGFGELHEVGQVGNTSDEEKAAESEKSEGHGILRAMRRVRTVSVDAQNGKVSLWKTVSPLKTRLENFAVTICVVHLPKLQIGDQMDDVEEVRCNQIDNRDARVPPSHEGRGRHAFERQRAGR